MESQSFLIACIIVGVVCQLFVNLGLVFGLKYLREDFNGHKHLNHDCWDHDKTSTPISLKSNTDKG